MCVCVCVPSGKKFLPHRIYREKGRICEFMTGGNGFRSMAGRRVAWQCQTHAHASPLPQPGTVIQAA